MAIMTTTTTMDQAMVMPQGWDMVQVLSIMLMVRGWAMVPVMSIMLSLGWAMVPVSALMAKSLGWDMVVMGATATRTMAMVITRSTASHLLTSIEEVMAAVTVTAIELMLIHHPSAGQQRRTTSDPDMVPSTAYYSISNHMKCNKWHNFCLLLWNVNPLY